ncbi:MAG: winged helix-turn-helix domain-containing protein [Ktedonobacterales bacterium]
MNREPAASAVIVSTVATPQSLAGYTVLVVEDEASIAELVRLYLAEAGARVLLGADGDSGIATFERERPHLVILDLMLPGISGWELCRRIRASERAETPILMLTALQTEDDRVRGFDLGADDYVTKPFSPRELVGRVRAILRRTALPGAASAPPTPSISPESRLEYPGLIILPARRRVEAHGEAADLTAKEFDLLVALASTPDRVFSRQELFSQVWGFDYLGDTRTVDVHVGTLRKKIERDPANPDFIQTVRGAGYRFGARDASKAAGE